MNSMSMLLWREDVGRGGLWRFDHILVCTLLFIIDKGLHSFPVENFTVRDCDTVVRSIQWLIHAGNYNENNVPL